MKKLLLTLLAAIVTGTSLCQVADYESQWKQIDALMEKQSYNTAREQTQALFSRAQQDRNSRQTLTAAVYLSCIEDAYREDASDSTIQRYLAVLPALQPVDKAICHTLIAQFYHNYKFSHSWQIKNNRPTNEDGLDYKLWPSSRFDDTITAHIRAALADEKLLTSVKSNDVAQLLDADSKTKQDYDLTPTLFDIIVWQAINMAESNNPRPDAPNVLAKRPLLEKLIAFHRNDDDCIRLYLDKEMLLMSSHPDHTRVINQYRGSSCPLLADLYHLKAQQLDEKEDYVAAVAYCDTGYTLFPKSEGGVNCANLKHEITKPSIRIEIRQRQMEQRDMLAHTEVRNVDTLFFRIVQWTDLQKVSNYGTYLAKRPVLKSWHQVCHAPADHTKLSLVSYLPPMPAGEYHLLVSYNSDFDKQGLVCIYFSVCDAALTIIKYDASSATCRLISRATGRAIPGVKVEMREDPWRNDGRLIATATTDTDGYVTFANPKKGRYGAYNVRYEYHGVGEQWDISFDDSKADTSARWEMFLDQPVYKPGDSVRFMAVCYQSDGKQKAHVCTNTKITLKLNDVNNKMRSSMQLTSDAFGQVHGVFALPSDALPGNWSIRSDKRYLHDINVQYYKQPKFTVKMPADSVEHRFGNPVNLAGSAVSYTEMPVEGARVEWRVQRSAIRPFWRWWAPYPSSSTVVVASGIATTASDGTFRFSFVPLPDSSCNLADKPCFEYVITAQVTDLNGETHEQRRIMRIGYENSGLILSDKTNIDHLPSVQYQYVNLDNQPLAGNVQITVDELRQPSTAKLSVVGTDRQTISREEFARRYPLYAYSADEVEPSLWPVKRNVLHTTHRASQTTPNEVPLPQLSSGVYRISVSTVNAAGDTLRDTRYVTLTLPCERQAQSNDLLWYHFNATTAEVGDTVVLRFGSRYRNVEVMYGLDIDGLSQQRRSFTLNNEMRTLSIPVTEAMRGGFSIYLCAVQENMLTTCRQQISVPYRNKQLSVRLVTFRDKLTPGQNETWSLQITPITPPSSLMLTMYDAALDTYGQLGWSLWPWRNNAGPLYRLYRFNQYILHSYNYLNNTQWYPGKDLSFTIQQLKSCDNGIPHIRYSRNAMYRKGAVESIAGAAAAIEIVEEEASGTARGGDGMVTMQGNTRMRKGIQVPKNAEASFCIAEDDTEVSDAASTGSGKQTELRQQLHTLAFFRPQLLADDSGRVSVTFRVPDLLTQWSIRGLAYTRELHSGLLETSAVTAKELMVVPNVPRFLRQGDQSDILVKVSNASDKEQTVKVTLQLSDAATGRIIYGHSDNRRIAAHSSDAVTFPVAVPMGVFAATYRVTAESATHSDGEQDVIPVLTNRVLVTESMSMYINGRSEKSYTMSSLRDNHSTSLQHHSLSVEFTANPVWYAVQSLPYVEDHKNPTNIYLANAIYANTIGTDIIARNPEIERTFRHWMAQEPDALTSRLEQNEELKQTLLQETPWLRNGTDETARQRRVAQFFDRTAMETALAQATDKLMQSQFANGAWSWIPGGRYPSEWTTAYILKTYGRLTGSIGNEATAPTRATSSVKEMLNRALAYVDGENYEYYLQCRRRNDAKATNIDYLYTRSFYPNAPLSAKCRQSYDYFYHNALSLYKNYDDLHTMAQLALIFHRHSDSRAALDLVRRIKERSLTSDEMGMYWRDNVSGLRSHQRPIEVQCLLIEAFESILPSDTLSPALMRQWLLKQKQTTSWNSDVATVNAVRTLLGGGSHLLDSAHATSVTLVVGNDTIATPQQYATGYQRQQWDAGHITPQQSTVRLSKRTSGVAWGAMYWQYYEDLDKMPGSAMGVTMKKTLYHLLPTGDMTVVSDKSRLHVGDKVRVRILIDCDRTLEYLELKDPRPSAFEPISTASGWRWNGGLSYYTAVYNASTTFFIDRLEKGKYVLEYDMYVTASGQRNILGGATLQSMYAPEFRSNTPGLVLTIEPQQQ